MDAAPTEIYSLSLHDALPISAGVGISTGDLESADEPPVDLHLQRVISLRRARAAHVDAAETHDGPQKRVLQRSRWRSEEHTSELQSRQYLVCRLLLEKKKRTG